jgi:hypothetical protein
VQLTIDISEKLARQVQPEREHLEEILQLGLQQRRASMLNNIEARPPLKISPMRASIPIVTKEPTSPPSIPKPASLFSCSIREWPLGRVTSKLKAPE